MKPLNQGIAGKIGTGVAGIALVAVIVAAANMILANARIRVDLTHERQHSLSSGTRQLLSNMDRDVVLKFYFSSADVPIDLKTYARHVADLLQEYRLASRGRVVLESYDPSPDSDSEEWAASEGLEPQTINPFAPPAYFGLVARCGSEQQCIPTLATVDDARLEYTVTRLLSRVLFPQKPVIGVMSSLPVLGMPMNPMMMMQQQPRDEGWIAFKMLKEDYDVRTVPPEADVIEPEISTLIVMHPKNLGDKTLFAIDQFVLRGGRLVACVDPLSSVDTRSSNAGNPMMQMMGGATPSTLGKLFDAWGVGFDTGKVIADLRAVTGLSGQGRVIESPTFLWIKPDRMNRDDLLSAQLNQLMLPFAGSLVDRTGGKLAFTPLIFSSADASCPIDAMGAQFASVSSIRTQFRADNIRHVLAARLKGSFTTAFPRGPEGTDTNAAPNQLVKGTSAVLIIADTDFLSDENCVRAVSMGFGMQTYQPINDNLTFFLNAVEQLSGREELLSLRARGSYKRPFRHVDELDLRAMQSWQAKEEELSKELEATRAQIQDLQQQKKGTQKLLLSREQQAAVENFRQKEMQINRQLKEVRKDLNRDKEALGVAVKTVNIAAIPLLVILFGIGRTIARRKR
ncbi:MAG: GldG family protein [bacterium]